jgi:biotin transport system permease protein
MSVLGVYHRARSPLHRLPAAIKLLALVGAAAGTHWLDRPARAGAGLLLVVALYAVARIPGRLLVAQARPLLWLVMVLLAAQLLLAGWRTAVVVTANLLALVLLAALVTLTTRTTALVDAVVAACRPLRFVGVDPERIGLLLALGVRSVAVVVGLGHEVREAQVARGLTASPTAFAVPLVVRSLRHADALGEALVARGVDD